ncbi:MAG TPA: DUF3558 family protein [Acidimicrobiia bacterium]|nr:DUF3558 family protein [Acidimicrobiia bacterium]
MRSSLTLTLALTVLVAACGGESGESPTTTAPSAVATADDDGAATTTGQEPPDETTVAPSGGGGEMLDPCALLTVEDIMTATGVPVDEGVFNEDLSSESQVICDWTGTEEFAFVQVLFQDIDSFEGNRDSAAEFTGEATDVAIPGVSAAFATGEGSIIGMQVDGGYLQVSYIPSGPGTVLEETTQLATVAAANHG